MTSGSLWKNILLFSLPLMMTQVLEVLFNLSDVAIAGKYAYNTYVALGSVGSTTTLVTLFTGLLIGLGGGVNVAVARGLGMGNDEDVEHTTHSSFLICLAMGVLTCLVCVFFAEPMLRLLHTKEEMCIRDRGYSSVGRAAVSKTACREFESFCPCPNDHPIGWSFFHIQMGTPM